MKNIILKVINYKHFLFFYWIFLAELSLIFNFQYRVNADEGIVLNNAWHILNGLDLYTDIFSYVAPGSFYLLSWVWRLTGISYFSANIFSIIILFFSSFFLYKSAQAIKKNHFNLLVPLIYIISSAWFPIINHNFYSSFFIILFVYFLLNYLQHKQNYQLILAGFLVGISVIFLQQKGLVVAGAGFLFLAFSGYKVRNKFKKLLFYIFSFLTPLLIFLAWPLNLIYQDLVYFPLFNYVGVVDIFWFKYFFVCLLFILTVISFKGNKNNNNYKINFLFYLQLFLLITVITFPDTYHILLSLFPLLLLVPSLLSLNIKNKFKKIIIKILAVTIILVFLLPSILNYKSIFISNSIAKNNLKELINKNCKSKYIFAGPFAPNIYFISRKLNPSSYNILLTNHHTPAQFDKALEQIKVKNTSCAIFAFPSSFEQFNYNKSNVVYSYFKYNYNLIYSKNSIFIFQKP